MFGKLVHVDTVLGRVQGHKRKARTQYLLRWLTVAEMQT